MWEFISGNGIKPPQKRKTDEDKNSYCYKYLKSLYYYDYNLTIMKSPKPATAGTEMNYFFPVANWATAF
jgi:hypothetical protein